MKNIHIIPTDKPTGIFESKNGLHFSIIEKIRYGEFKGFHIYITSDEEIKGGDYFWKPDCNMIFKAEYTPHKGCKKIILTTDQDLIKDGIQEISEDFLHWFIKNPSCESVEVDKNWNYPLDKSWEYKIIIPQEKQIKCYCGHTTYCDCEPLQETLEDAAESWVNNRFTKQICGNESYPDIHASKEGIVESHIIFANWQKERMYSEDEVKHIISEALKSALVTVDLEQWFEQHKKK
jgi:hypothetical protein